MDADSSLVVLEVGPAWDRSRALHQQEHAIGHIAFVTSLLRSGTAVMAGPFSQLDQPAFDERVGVLILSVGPDRAAEVVADDPAVRNGLLSPRIAPFFPLRVARQPDTTGSE